MVSVCVCFCGKTQSFTPTTTDNQPHKSPDATLYASCTLWRFGSSYIVISIWRVLIQCFDLSLAVNLEKTTWRDETMYTDDELYPPLCALGKVTFQTENHQMKARNPALVFRMQGPYWYSESVKTLRFGVPSFYVTKAFLRSFCGNSFQKQTQQVIVKPTSNYRFLFFKSTLVRSTSVWLFESHPIINVYI